MALFFRNSTSTMIFMMLLAALVLALSHYFQSYGFGISALSLGFFAGLFIGNTIDSEIPDIARKVFKFNQQKILRTGIVLFGFQLTLSQVKALGWEVLWLDLLVVAIIFVVGSFIGVRYLKLNLNVAMLTSAGSAICGAAAVLATEPLLKAKQHETAMAIATVVLFGTLSMLLYPVFYHYAGMNATEFGIYAGATIHEVAHVVAAGDAINNRVLEVAIISKLTRVMLLIPFLILLSIWLQRKNKSQESSQFKLPLFLVGFLATMLINSVIDLPESVVAIINQVCTLCLVLAMIALGFDTRFSQLKALGPKPLVLALILFLLLTVGGYFATSLLLS